MSDYLRDQVIRLAYTKPEYRNYLLPILTQDIRVWASVSDVEAAMQMIEDSGQNLDVVPEQHYYEIQAREDDAQVWAYVSAGRKPTPAVAFLQPGIPSDKRDVITKALKSKGIPMFERKGPPLSAKEIGNYVSKISLKYSAEDWGFTFRGGGIQDYIGIDTTTSGTYLIYLEGHGEIKPSKDYTFTDAETKAFISKIASALKMLRSDLPFGKKGSEEVLKDFFVGRESVLKEAIFWLKKGLHELKTEKLDAETGQVQVRGRFNESLLPKNQQTAEQLAEAEHVATKLKDMILTRMPEAMESALENLDYEKGDKNYFYLNFQFNLPKVHFLDVMAKTLHQEL